MSPRRRLLGEILIRWGVLTTEQVEEALGIAKGSHRRIGEVLVDLGYAGEVDVAKALASQHNLEYIDLTQPDSIKSEAKELIPMDLVKKYLVLPISREGNRLKVVVHDPNDLSTLDTLRFRLNCEIETALGARSQIRERIDSWTGETDDALRQLTQTLSIDEDELQVVDHEAAAGDESAKGAVEDSGQAPIIRLVNKLIMDAVRGRASDIHIEPFERKVRLRYRIDGVCHELEPIPKVTQSSVLARLKIMAGMKIQEKRIPQDGRIKMKIDKETIDFRVAACPSYHGESVVMRILRPEAARIGLERLGMRQDTLETFERIIKRPNGIFLVTGPTGSGKTTTLYSALDVLNRPDRKIITAEDPVEYNFKGINQCQVNDQIGLSFARILRAMLRQAPNIILVGEIRDKEVGEVAIQAALTGHLVFSTLHTNDAPSAITRLVDMGIKPFLVASSIQAVLAQRLVRLLCPKCKEPDNEPNPRLMRLCGINSSDLENRKVYRAVGCKNCGNTGYRGRNGIYELMLLNSEIRELAFKRAPLGQLRAAALASGMRPLIGDGRLKVLDGHTTLSEIARITQVEGVVDVDDEAA
ncbi:MAG: Flp pilus assembly complex ATPase component TadA [Phycisphaeraceae bacterium]|nr:Flp pilus assembly complex ATPase component TadA [Phycisphaeraceae bacterium]